MENALIPTLTDGIIRLRPLTQPDAPALLAGEDEDMAKWLNGGHSTAATVQAAIAKFEAQWSTGGPRRAFGVFDCDKDQLIGFVEANLALLADPEQVNVAYGIFASWRGRGLAVRAINLMAEYLRSTTTARKMVLQIAVENRRSIRVAEKTGFTQIGVYESTEGPRVRYIRDL